MTTQANSTGRGRQRGRQRPATSSPPSQPGPNPRKLAASILGTIGRTQGFSNRILDHELSRVPGLSTRDRGLTTSLVYGVLRHRGRLDAVIDHFAQKPRGLKGQVRTALRIGAFELLELGHPLHAVASEVAKLLRKVGNGKMLRPCHALIAAIDREGAACEQAFAEGAPLDVLQRRYSIPRWLGGRWLAHLGPERALRRAAALTRPCPVDLRIDCTRTDLMAVEAALKTTRPDCEITRITGQPQALRVRRGGPIAQSDMYKQGLFSIQAIGSQQAVRALAVTPGERVLDACAGIGVKTLQLAECLDRRGTLVATEPLASRVAELHRTAERGGLNVPSLEFKIIETATDQPDVAGLDGGPLFDAVLVDAPCTGLGNLGRHPELRWTSRYEDIATCVALQRQLLRVCWQRVAPGGRLCYAVCSLEPEEGEQLVTEFLTDTQDAQLGETHAWTPDGDQTDGFYFACLQRAPTSDS